MVMISFLGYPLQTIVVLVWVCLCLVIGLPCIVSLYKGIKHWKKRKQNQYSQSSESHDPEKQEVSKVVQCKCLWDCNVAYCDIDAYDLFYFWCPQKETHKCVQSKDVVSRLLPVQPDPVLPDCIPREIKSMCVFVCYFLPAV